MLRSCATEAGVAALAADFASTVNDLERVVVQTCEACGACWFPPLLRCPHCQAARLGWVEGGDQGEVATWVTVHTTQETPSFSVPRKLRERVPYATLFVRLAALPGVRVPALMAGDAVAQLRVGTPVRLVVESGRMPSYIAHALDPDGLDPDGLVTDGLDPDGLVTDGGTPVR